MIDSFSVGFVVDFFLQVGKRGDVIPEDGYTTADQMLGNCFQIPCTHTACFQRKVGAEILRFDRTWHSNQVSSGRQLKFCIHIKR